MVSSCPDAIAHLPDSLKAQKSSHSFNPDSSQIILVVKWILETDTLWVQVNEKDSISTKRQLLSKIARMFDPLGLLSPFTVLLKFLLQDVWKLDIA